MISAILGTREGAAEGGYQLTSTGVTWTDPIEAAALRDALAAHKVENVMLVSSFLAAAALAQAVGNATNYAHTALLFIEPDTATLAIVDSADGSIVGMERRVLPEDDDAAVAELSTLVSGAEALDTRPDGVFIVGSGVDVPLIKPTLDAATALPVSAPEEPETALARGAALASANAPLFNSSTAAHAYAQDPGTGAVLPYELAHGFYDIPAVVEGGAGAEALAYSAVPDDFADAYTASSTAATGLVGVDEPERRSFTLIGTGLAAIFIIGVAALAVSLAITIRPTGVRPDPGHNIVAPAPQPAVAPVAPAPAAVPAPAPAPELAPAPAPAPAPAAAPAPVPQAPAPIPDVPAPAPVPVPAAPAPAPPPIAPPPLAPPGVPVPIPIPLPIFGGPPGGHGGGYPGEGPPGHYGGGPHEGGGFPGFPGGGGHGGFGGGFGGHGGHR